jgi:hypothetical protein
MNTKRTILIATLIVLGAAVTLGGISYAQGMWGGGYGPGGWGCPMCGGYYGSGPGYGYGMGPGMMWRGYGPGYGYGYGQQYQQSQRPITKSDAESMLQNYVSRNPNLKLGAVKEEGNTFEANVTTKDGSLVNKLYVDRGAGWGHSEY